MVQRQQQPSPQLPFVPLRSAWIFARMRMGDVEVAMILLHEALDTVRQHFHPAFDRNRTSKTAQKDHQLQLVMADKPLPYPSNMNETSLCFLCPCHIKPRHGDTVNLLQCSTHDLELISLWLFYNLSLCYHFRVLTCPATNQYNNVEQAVVRYRIGMRLVNCLLSHPLVDIDADCNADLAVMIRPCAAVLGHNLTALFAQAYEWDAMEACAEWTLHHVYYASNGQDNDDPDSWICRVWANVFLWKTLREQAASAA